MRAAPATVVAAMMAAVPPPGHAAGTDPRWSLHWSPRTDAAERLLNTPYAPKRQTSRITRRDYDGDLLALEHVFRDLDLPAVDGVAPATNGYVHRLSLGWRRDGADHRLALGAGVAVSSNALKRPQELRGSDLQPLIEASTRVGASWIGLRVDDRLGALRLVPTLTYRWQPAPAHSVELGFPDSAWHAQIGRRWQTSLAIGPDGGCWQVRDRALMRRSRVCSDAWQAGWRIERSIDSGQLVQAALGVTIGRRLAGEIDYTLDDGRRVTLGTPAAWFGALHLSTRF
jgi:hypothetical protein